MKLKKYKLGDIGKIVTGKTPSTQRSDYFKGNIPFITPEDISKGFLIESTKRHISNLGYDSIKSNTIDGFSILVGCIGSDMGNVAFSKIRCATNQQINSITQIIDIFDPSFIYYTLSTKKEYFRTLAGSTTTPILPKSVFENIELSLPELETQRKIAAVLTALDDKIALNRRMNAKLEAMAKRLYDYWFVQFDFPDENGKPYKSSGGKMVWNEQLKREIPAGWEVKRLGEMIENCSGGEWGNAEYSDNANIKVKCIRGADITNLSDMPIRYISTKKNNKLIKPNSLVIEISGGSPIQSTGRIAFISKFTLDRFEVPLVCSNFCQVIILKDELIVPWFYSMWNRFYETGTFFNYEGKTNGIKNLQLANFLNTPSILPPKQYLEQFNDIFQTQFRYKENFKIEITRLTSLRDRLLPLLMNGQVEVG